MNCVQAATDEIVAWAEIMGWKELMEVPCKPEPGCKEGECFANVEKMMERSGGAPCYGQMFVEIPGQAVQTEAHAVWKDPAGNLVDISEKRTPVTRILFAPDEKIGELKSAAVGEYLLLSSDPRIRRLFEFERGLELWAGAQIRMNEQQDPVLIRLDFASLRQLIAKADMPTKVVGTLLNVNLKARSALALGNVPEDVVRLLKA